MKIIALLTASATAIKMRQEPANADLESTAYDQVQYVQPEPADQFATESAASATEKVEAWMSSEKEMLTAFRDKVFENAIA